MNPILVGTLFLILMFLVVEIIAAVVLILYNKHIELLDAEVNRLLKTGEE